MINIRQLTRAVIHDKVKIPGTSSILLLKPQVSMKQAVSVTGWPVTVGVVDTRYGVSQPGADAER